MFGHVIKKAHKNLNSSLSFGQAALVTRTFRKKKQQQSHVFFGVIFYVYTNVDNRERARASYWKQHSFPMLSQAHCTFQILENWPWPQGNLMITRSARNTGKAFWPLISVRFRAAKIRFSQILEYSMHCITLAKERKDTLLHNCWLVTYHANKTMGKECCFRWQWKY